MTSLATADGAVAPLPVRLPAQAFETLFRTHYDGLVRLSIVFGMSQVEAEEAVQDAFFAYSRSASKVATGSELAYLRRSTINATLDRHRRARRAPVRSIEPADEWLSETDVSESLGDRALVREAVWALPPGQRACVILRFIEGLSEVETADALDVSLGTVKKQMSRARATLRTFLEASNATR